MSNIENEFGVAEAEPKGTMEQLQKVTPAKKDDDKRQGRVPWANETHQEEMPFQVASVEVDKGKVITEKQPDNKDQISQNNWINRYENKQSETFGKEGKEPLLHNKIESKPEKNVNDTWINRYENKANNFYGGAIKQDEKHLEKGEQVEKIEGKKIAYNEDNNKAKGKSLFEVKAASATQNAESIIPIQQQGQNTGFGDLVKKSIPESSVKIQKKPQQVVSQVKPISQEMLIKPPSQNTEQKQTNDKPPVKSFTEMVRNTIKPTTPPPPPSGPKR